MTEDSLEPYLQKLQLPSLDTVQESDFTWQDYGWRSRISLKWKHAQDTCPQHRWDYNYYLNTWKDIKKII